MSRNLLTEQTKEVIFRLATPASFRFSLREAAEMLHDKDAVGDLHYEYEYSVDAICNARFLIESAESLHQNNVYHCGDTGYIDDGEPRHYTSYDLHRLFEVLWAYGSDEKGFANEVGSFIVGICEFIRESCAVDSNGSCDATRTYTFYDGSRLEVSNPREEVYPMSLTSFAKEG